jgi:hypothetical protein
MTAAGEPAEGDVTAIEAGESLQAALQRMVDQGVDQLPVTEHNRLVGVCTRADVMAAQLRPLALEQREQGWLGRRANRNGNGSDGSATNGSSPGARNAAPQDVL